MVIFLCNSTFEVARPFGIYMSQRERDREREAMSAQRWAYARRDFHTFAVPTHVCETDGA